jgi:hypothetical protein
MLHCAIKFLAGGSYHDIHATANISKASFFCLVQHTIDAINSCNALDDLMWITAPSHTECGDVGWSLFFWTLLYLWGKFSIKKTSLPAWLDSLPPGYISIDCAYSITEHSIAPYSGLQ